MATLAVLPLLSLLAACGRPGSESASGERPASALGSSDSLVDRDGFLFPEQALPEPSLVLGKWIGTTTVKSSTCADAAVGAQHPMKLWIELSGPQSYRAQRSNSWPAFGPTPTTTVFTYKGAWNESDTQTAAYELMLSVTPDGKRLRALASLKLTGVAGTPGKDCTVTFTDEAHKED